MSGRKDGGAETRSGEVGQKKEAAIQNGIAEDYVMFVVLRPKQRGVRQSKKLSGIIEGSSTPRAALRAKSSPYSASFGVQDSVDGGTNE